MPKPFDAATKHLIESQPGDWLEYVGLARAAVDVFDLDFEYEIVRAWKKSVEEVLAGGLGALAMAPLADVTAEMLPSVIRRMEERIEREASPREAGEIWTATYVLMGLRYSRAVATVLLQRVQAMKESVTYQAIVEEGQIAALQATLLRQGTKRFGSPAQEIRNVLNGIASVERLESLTDRLLDVENWDELLAG